MLRLGFLALLTLLLIGSLSLPVFKFPSYSYLLKFIQLLCFCISGWILTSKTERYVENIHPGSSLIRWVAYLFIMLLILFVLFFLYLILYPANLGMATASACSFILPFALTKTWEIYSVLDSEKYYPWYPSSYRIDPNGTLQISSLSILIRLKINVTDANDTCFKIQVPGRMKLNSVFYHFLNQCASEGLNIQINKESGSEYGWKFFKELSGGFAKKYFNPGMSIIQNEIQPGCMIFIERAG